MCYVAHCHKNHVTPSGEPIRCRVPGIKSDNDNNSNAIASMCHGTIRSLHLEHDIAGAILFRTALFPSSTLVHLFSIAGHQDHRWTSLEVAGKDRKIPGNLRELGLVIFVKK
jgi:hypothetical protein